MQLLAVQAYVEYQQQLWDSSAGVMAAARVHERKDFFQRWGTVGVLFLHLVSANGIVDTKDKHEDSLQEEGRRDEKETRARERSRRNREIRPLLQKVLHTNIRALVVVSHIPLEDSDIGTDLGLTLKAWQATPFASSSTSTFMSGDTKQIDNVNMDPRNWERCKDENGNIFFYNKVTEQSQWEAPAYLTQQNTTNTNGTGTGKSLLFLSGVSASDARAGVWPIDLAKAFVDFRSEEVQDDQSEQQSFDRKEMWAQELKKGDIDNLENVCLALRVGPHRVLSLPAVCNSGYGGRVGWSFGRIRLTITAASHEHHVFMQPTCVIPQPTVANILLGPIVGLVTSTTAIVLLEVDRPCRVACTLTDVLSGQSFVVTIPLRARRPGTFSFKDLPQGRRYAITFIGARRREETGHVHDPLPCGSLTTPQVGASFHALVISGNTLHDLQPGEDNLWKHLGDNFEHAWQGPNVLVHAGGQVSMSSIMAVARTWLEAHDQKHNEVGEADFVQSSSQEESKEDLVDTPERGPLWDKNLQHAMEQCEKMRHARVPNTTYDSVPTTSFGEEEVLEWLRDEYRRTWNLPHVQKMLSHHSNLMIWNASDVCCGTMDTVRNEPVITFASLSRLIHPSSISCLVLLFSGF